MILVLSDVHIRPDRPERTERFARFIASHGEARALYILGDLFDFWIGPRHPRTPGVEDALRALGAAAARGVEVNFIPGNRDFHLDRATLDPLGVRLLGDSHLLVTGAGRLLLAHGDQLCTRDMAYRITRAVIRCPPARMAWRALPPGVAVNLAGGFRGVSLRSVKRKPRTVKEVTREGIRRALRPGVDAIVCGHVHRQEHRRIQVNGKQGDLYTLASWDRGEPHLVVDGNRIYFGDDRRHDG